MKEHMFYRKMGFFSFQEKLEWNIWHFSFDSETAIDRDVKSMLRYFSEALGTSKHENWLYFYAVKLCFAMIKMK